jgi:hypothetical protein
LTIRNLTDAETAIVKECLWAAANGPFFDDDDFETIFGLTRVELAAVASHWPQVDASDERVECAVSNSLNNLLSYPHQQGAQWSRFISVASQRVAEILDKWHGEPIKSYFNGLR